METKEPLTPVSQDSMAGDDNLSVESNASAEVTPAAVRAQFASADIKKRLSALKALQPIMESVIANPGSGASSEDKSRIVARLMASSHKHLPELTSLVSAEGPWATAMVASVLNGMVTNAWKKRSTSSIDDSMALLSEISKTPEFRSFSQEIGSLDWNRQINDPLDGISAMRLTAMNASQKFIDNIRVFDFLQEDHSELVGCLLKLSHKLAFSVENEVRKMPPYLAISYRQSMLDRASSIVSAEYDRIACFNKKRLEDMLQSADSIKYEATKASMKKGGMEGIMKIIERYATSSFGSLLAATDSYVEMLDQYGSQHTQKNDIESKGA